MSASLLSRAVWFCLVVLALTGLPDTASAYIGPGAGITAIGTVIALIGAVLLGIVGFVWYPLKRLLGGRAKAKDQQQHAQPQAPGHE